MAVVGPLAFVGGREWRQGCDFDAQLAEMAGASEVLILPTAAAYEDPASVVAAAVEWFKPLDLGVDHLALLTRRDAADPEMADRVRRARFIYLADGSALHLRSVLKDSPIMDALVEAWTSGAAIAGSAAGATVLGDPMVDPRGGSFTLGLGLVRGMAAVPHWDRWTSDRAKRMSHLVPRATVVAEIEEATALIRHPDGTWTSSGAGDVALSFERHPITFGALEENVQIDASA
jgi:cyanophycinase